MNLIGVKVRNLKLGEGVVTRLCDSEIYVRFSDREARIGFPEVFYKSYKIEDAQALEYVSSLVAEGEAKKIEQFSTPMKKHEEEERKKLKLRSNIAFKCNWCDGGATQERLGFDGVCSDEAISYNVHRRKRAWCTSQSCSCLHYSDGKVDRSELEEEFKDGFLCYESAMLRDWYAYAGADQNGASVGKSRGIRRAAYNSLAMLTTCAPNTGESERCIFAVFLIDELFEGNERDVGYVGAQEKFRIELSPREARETLYWKYHTNANSSKRALWGTGLFRYINDIEAAQLLRDIAVLKRGTADEQLADELFGYFCSLCRIDPEKLPQPSGVLCQDN